MELEYMEADVLCVGGGIAGLMAAIRASELGAKVIVAEKTNTVRSGGGAMGNDHFACYIPDVHGPDYKPVVDELRLGQMAGRLQNPELVKVWFENTYRIVKLWDAWGIPMKYDGKYEFAGHSFPGRPQAAMLKYAGLMQKPVLTREAKERGAKIVNRTMIFDLLGRNGVTGAIGVSTRQDKLIQVRAKSVVLGTGVLRRLYPTPTPGCVSNSEYPGTTQGDGRAMAFRLGAELVNMEMLGLHAGPKYFIRSGQGTWVGVIRDPKGSPVGPFVSKPDKKCGDMIIGINKGVFTEYAKSGRGPLYMDCTGISNDDLEYMNYWLKHEGNLALIKYLEEEGIDLGKNPVEFMTYDAYSVGTIRCNEKAEASVAGLYAAGDETLGGISAAATFGWIAGEQAAKYAQRAVTQDIEHQETVVEEKRAWLERIRSRETGPDWREANIALQQIMNDYAGPVRSETLLEAGLAHLRRLRQKAYETVIARNQHELMRSLEVFNLLELGELVFLTALERKETRRSHVRADYPFTNPLLDQQIAVKKVDDKPVIGWIPIGS